MAWSWSTARNHAHESNSREPAPYRYKAGAISSNQSHSSPVTISCEVVSFPAPTPRQIVDPRVRLGLTEAPSPPPIDAEEVPFDVRPPRRSAEPAVGFPSAARPAPQLSQAIDTLRRRALQGKGNHSEQFLQALSSIRHYDWLLDEKEAEARTSIQAALVTPDDDELTFHLRNLVDVYNCDRATRATVRCGLGKPMRMHEIPQSVERGDYYRRRTYWLKWERITFDDKTPHSAANSVAKVRLFAPPDSFHIAEYVADHTTYDPVIYARYGSWNVEIARWDD